METRVVPRMQDATQILPSPLPTYADRVRNPGQRRRKRRKKIRKALARACFDRTSFITIPTPGQPVSVQDDIVDDVDLVSFPPFPTTVVDIIDNDILVVLTPPSTTLITNIPTLHILYLLSSRKNNKNRSTRGHIPNKSYVNITTEQLQEVKIKLAHLQSQRDHSITMTAAVATYENMITK